MSLKAFHIFFVIASIVLSYGFAVWSFRTPVADRLMGAAAVLAGLALTVYLSWFLKKRSR